MAQQEAIANGCDQVVFLDAQEGRYVEELGGMNMYFVYDDGSIVTPELTGTILEGITRDAILALAGELGHKVDERRIEKKGIRLGVLDNSKGNADYLLKFMVDGLKASGVPVKALKVRPQARQR